MRCYLADAFIQRDLQTSTMEAIKQKSKDIQVR